MRAGFEVYRAFIQDCADVKQNVAEHGKLTIPVLASGGADSAFTAVNFHLLPSGMSNTDCLHHCLFSSI